MELLNVISTTEHQASVNVINRAKLKARLSASTGLRAANVARTRSFVAPWSRADKVRQAINYLDEILETGRSLRTSDQAWLGSLRQVFGTTSLVVPDDDSGESKRLVDLTSVASLNATLDQRRHLEALADTLRARISAEEYEVHIRRLGAIDVPCHNREIASKLRNGYDLADLDSLVNFALDKGVFDVELHETTGLVRTCGSRENWDMFARQWVTDTTRADELEQALEPELWRNAMLTLARFYSTPRELAAFELYINNPVLYRQGGLTAGVAHIFIPETLERDPSWFNNKRLESPGLALQRLCLTLAAGLVYAEPWGFTSEELNANEDEKLRVVAGAVVNLSAFLKAINTAQPEHIDAVFKLDQSKMETTAAVCVNRFQAQTLTAMDEETAASFELDGRNLADLVGAYLTLVSVSKSKNLGRMLASEGWAVDNLITAYCRATGQAKVEVDAIGFYSSDLSFRESIETISHLATYLEVTYQTTKTCEEVFDFAAPSAGPWEEQPFAGGLTGDTEIVRRGFECLHNLVSLFAIPELAHVPTMAALKESIAGTTYGAWLDGASDYAVLKKLTDAGRARVIERLLGGPNPVEHELRPADSSLTFISTSTICLGDTPVEDVEAHFKVLEYVERMLVRDNGMIRYAPFAMGTVVSPDSYLGANYWLVPALRVKLNTGAAAVNARSFGSKDCSSEEELLARASICVNDTEAEWGWVSVASEGYSTQVAKLIELALSRGTKPSDRELQLIAHGHKKATEMLNRSYARITGERTDGTPWAKSNGKECPRFALPEAYEYVSPASSQSAEISSLRALPGAHTPLAWAQSSLWGATKKYWQNAQLLTELNLAHVAFE